MIKIQDSSRTFWITFLVITIPISLLALYQAVPQLASQDIAPWRSKWTAILLALILNIFAGGLAIWGLARGSLKTFWDESIRLTFRTLVCCCHH